MSLNNPLRPTEQHAFGYCERHHGQNRWRCSSAASDCRWFDVDLRVLTPTRHGPLEHAWRATWVHHIPWDWAGECHPTKGVIHRSRTCADEACRRCLGHRHAIRRSIGRALREIQFGMRHCAEWHCAIRPFWEMGFNAGPCVSARRKRAELR